MIAVVFERKQKTAIPRFRESVSRENCSERRGSIGSVKEKCQIHCTGYLPILKTYEQGCAAASGISEDLPDASEVNKMGPTGAWATLVSR